MRHLAAGMLALLWVLAASPAGAERLVSTLSSETVQITSSFSGETVSIFGNIEPEAGSGQRFVDGPFHVVIVIVGPTADRVARQKTNRLGLWINTDQVVFEDFPSFFWVLSSGKLTSVTDQVTLAVENILPEAQARHSAVAGWWKSVTFGRELVRLMTEKSFYGVNETGVQFLSETAYKAQLALPSDIPNGPFLAQTYVFKDGKIIARKSEGFAVRKIGFERFLGSAATQYPLLYGLAAVALALFTGWLGGVVFKR